MSTSAPVSVREFRRSDRDLLTELVNLHIAAVLPGVRLSTNAVLGQLEREPGERVVDPWVIERRCLVAVENEAVVGAALLHRFADEARVNDGYRAAAEIRWLVVEPTAPEAGRALLAATIDLARGWSPTHLYADAGSLPAPGCYGVPGSWPHVRDLLLGAGFGGPTRTETVLAVRCEALLGHRLDGATVSRSVGGLGTRFDLMVDQDSAGFIEVCNPDAALTRSATAAAWSDVGNLFATDPDRLDTVMPALLTAAAEWLLLGGVDRLLEYYADDVHPPQYLDIARRVGFVELTTNERGWELSA